MRTIFLLSIDNDLLSEMKEHVKEDDPETVIYLALLKGGPHSYDIDANITKISEVEV